MTEVEPGVNRVTVAYGGSFAHRDFSKQSSDRQSFARRTFAELLCAAAEASTLPRERVGELRFLSVEGPKDLFEPPLAVETDLVRARTLWKELSRNGYGAGLTACFEAWCSDARGKENPIGRVLTAMLREIREHETHPETRSGPRKSDLMDLRDLSDPDILFAAKAAQRCRSQAHKITGLIRFSELSSGLWYASIHPECDVLPLIGAHFSRRFPDTRFVIHDLRRSSAILHEAGAPWRIVEGISLQGVSSSLDLPASERENVVRDQWKTYFESVAIEERKNPSLQRQFMPKKYWDSLPEMDPRA